MPEKKAAADRAAVPVVLAPAKTPASDREAIALMQRGQEAGFEHLYRAHKRRVYSLCLRMTNSPHIAEELAQEAFLLAFRRIKTFRGDSAFSTWLHRIAVNVALMHLRKQRSQPFHSSFEEQDTFSEDDMPRDRIGEADSRLDSSIDRIALLRAIEQLAPGYRIVLVLHDIEGYEHSEIAEMLGCSVGNTKSQLHKARLRLRQMLVTFNRERQKLAA